MKTPDIIVYTLSSQSAMGQFASELVRGTTRISDTHVILIAPPMEHEPDHCQRVVLPLPWSKKSRILKLASMAWMSIAGSLAVLRHARRGKPFVMVELGSTVPVSAMPALVARLRGAVTVLNLHDFYPHAFRFGPYLRGFEKALYRWCFRRFDLIAAMKAPQLDRLRDEVGINPDRVLIIDHGPFVIADVKPPTAETELVRVLVFGTLRSNKMLLESIQAIKQLQSEGVKVTLRIAGAPSHQEQAYWAACRAELSGVEGAEIIDRYIDDRELPAILSGIDGMLCPYQNFDSQSGVSIVAASNGIPLLATQSASITGADDGLFPIASPVSVQAIVGAISRFVAVPRSDRQSRAHLLRINFEKRAIWDEAAKSILAKATQFASRSQ